MGEILKKHWPFLVLALVTIAGSAALLFLISSSSDAVAAKQKELDDVKRTKERINKFPVRITPENLVKARENADVAWESYNKAFSDLYKDNPNAENGKYNRAPLTGPLVEFMPAEAKLRITNRCSVMRDALRGRKVDVASANVANFTFDRVVGTDWLPPVEKVPVFMRNLFVINELVEVVAESGVRSLDSIERPNDELQEEAGRFKYLPLKISVTGTYHSVRKLMNNINDADYLFIVRDMRISTTDITSNMPTRRSNLGIGPGDPRVQSMPKEDRIVFTDLAQVKLQIELDYVEVMKHEKQ